MFYSYFQHMNFDKYLFLIEKQLKIQRCNSIQEDIFCYLLFYLHTQLDMQSLIHLFINILQHIDFENCNLKFHNHYKIDQLDSLIMLRLLYFQYLYYKFLVDMVLEVHFQQDNSNHSVK